MDVPLKPPNSGPAMAQCPLIKDSLSLSTWISGKAPQGESRYETAIQLLLDHLNSRCVCMSKTSVLIFIGNAYYHLFKLKRRSFSAQFAEEVCVPIAPDSENSDDSEPTSLTSSPDQVKPSKLDSDSSPAMVNFNSLNSIMEPLNKAVDYWKQAFAKLKATELNLIWKLQVVQSLSDAYYVFVLYKMSQRLLDCSDILQNIGQMARKDHPEILVTALYFRIKFYLQLQCVDLANPLLLKAESLVNMIRKTKKTETYETKLIQLARIEMDILCGQTSRSAKNLKDFIDSEYLQRLSLNRFYLKGIALHLVSQFTINGYNYSSGFYEFIEPVQMAISVLKRWHRPLFPASGDGKKRKAEAEGTNDPVWYQMAIYDFAFKSFLVAAKFYVNISLPCDLIYAYNALLKIGRMNCCVSWVAQLLIIGADVDYVCDKKDYSLLKLHNASALFNPEAVVNRRLSNFISLPPNKFNSPSVKDVINFEESWSDMYSSPTKENISCAHKSGLSLHEMRRKFLKEQTSDRFVSVDCDNDEVFIDSQILVKSPDPAFEVMDASILKLEVAFGIYILKYESTKSLEQMEYYYYSILPKVYSSYSEQLRSLVKTEIADNLLTFVNNLKLKMANCLSKKYISRGEYKKALEFLVEFFGDSNTYFTGSYVNQITASELLFKFLCVKMKLMKLKNILSGYDARKAEDAISKAFVKDCPSPPLAPRSKTTRTVPKAPNGKNSYKSEDFKEYIDTLTDIVYKQNKSMKIAKLKQTKKSDDWTSTSDLGKKSVSLSQSSQKEESTILRDTCNIASKSKVRSKSMAEKNSSDDSNQIGRRKVRSRTIATELSRGTTFEDGYGDFDENCFDSINDIASGENPITPVFSLPHLTEINSTASLEKLITSLMISLGKNPPSNLYTGLHELLFKIGLSTHAKNCDSTAYHFAESTGASLRYRAQMLNERKKKIQCSDKMNLYDLCFDPQKSVEPTEFQTLLDEVPPAWRIVQVHYIDNGRKIPDIIVCRYQQNKKPIFLHIIGNESKFTANFMVEFHEIISLSNASITSKDPKTFWKVRFGLDKRLELLLRSMDDAWFGPFKGLFIGEPEDEKYKNLCSQMKIQINEVYTKLGFICANEDLLDVVIESFPVISKFQFIEALGFLFNNFSSSWITECYKKCDRLLREAYPSQEVTSLFKNVKLNPVGLILNKPIESFPFESLPTFQLCEQSFFRIPSLRFLSCILKSSKSETSLLNKKVDQSSAYYILNPSNNLSKTETYFKESFEAKEDWKGVTGETPNPQELKTALETKDLYIFFGHGAGSCYYRQIPGGLDRVNLHSASVVIGCCSGKLISEGESLDSYGMPYRFLISGSPCYVGVLWDVTDRDIDKFSDQLLTSWLPRWKEDQFEYPMSVDRAVAKSRSACKLKYLIGAAPVVYGLPLTVSC